MKRATPILIFFLLASGFTFGQQQADTNKPTQQPVIGFQLGTLVSMFYYNIQDITSSDNLRITSENNYKTGFTAGITFSLINAKHFSFQPEINYQLVRQNIKYTYTKYSHSMGSGLYYDEQGSAEYCLNASFLQVALMFKVKTGKTFQTYLGLGPSVSFPLNNKIKGQIERSGSGSNTPSFHTWTKNKDDNIITNTSAGGFVAAGLNVPYKNNNFGLEFRIYFCPGLLIEYLGARQTYFTLCLTYQIKSKTNVW